MKLQHRGKGQNRQKTERKKKPTTTILAFASHASNNFGQILIGDFDDQYKIQRSLWKKNSDTVFESHIYVILADSQKNESKVT